MRQLLECSLLARPPTPASPLRLLGPLELSEVSPGRLRARKTSQSARGLAHSKTQASQRRDSGESGQGSVNFSSCALEGGEGAVGVFIIFSVRLRFELLGKMAGLLRAERAQRAE